MIKRELKHKLTSKPPLKVVFKKKTFLRKINSNYS